jgi:hypothetical protein
MSLTWDRRLGQLWRAAALAVLLASCGQAAPTAARPTRSATVGTITLSPTPTAVPVRSTATPLPPGSALAQIGTEIASRSTTADQQNAALAARLNAGTTLPPLLPALAAAVTADERAAAAISGLPLPPPLDSYRAVAQYRAEEAAGYGTLADAWAALARAAQQQGDETLYQTLAARATDSFHAAAAAKDRAAIALGLAPEGSAPD